MSCHGHAIATLKQLAWAASQRSQQLAHLQAPVMFPLKKCTLLMAVSSNRPRPPNGHHPSMVTKLRVATMKTQTAKLAR